MLKKKKKPKQAKHYKLHHQSLANKHLLVLHSKVAHTTASVMWVERSGTHLGEL